MVFFARSHLGWVGSHPRDALGKERIGWLREFVQGLPLD